MNLFWTHTAARFISERFLTKRSGLAAASLCPKPATASRALPLVVVADGQRTIAPPDSCQIVQRAKVIDLGKAIGAHHIRRAPRPRA